MLVFFWLAGVAATGAMLSLMEVPVVVLHERLGWSRPKATLASLLLLMLLGSGCALSNNALANFKLWGLTLFDLFDFVSSNLLLPAGGIFIALFAGWAWRANGLQRALSNHGQLRNEALARMLVVLLRYVSPLLILLVMLKGLKLF